MEYFRGQPYTNNVHLDFNLDIMKARHANTTRYLAAHTPDAVTKEAVEGRLKDGFSMVDEANVFVDAEISAELFDQLADLLARYDTIGGADAKTLVALREKGSIDVAGLIRASLSQNESFFTELAEETDTDASLLAVIGENLARPVLAFHATGMEGTVELLGDNRNTCPCCGNDPVMAMLDAESGRRFLKCSLCHTHWEFQRMECPHCGNREDGGAKYLFYDEEDPHRVDVCEECKRYVRTVDLRKTQNRTVVLDVEAIATGYLDDMAMKQGYLLLPE